MSFGYEYDSFSSYGGGGFDMGGGFGGQQYGGQADPMGSFDVGGGFMGASDPRSAEKKHMNKEKQSITPLSIGQLLQAFHDDDQNKVDNHNIHVVRIIGNIESVDPQSTATSYRISDESGLIECKHYLGKDGESGSVASLKTNEMVKVHGVLRRFENKIHLLVYNISRIEDFNEVTHHLLECLYLRLQRVKGPLPTNEKAPTGAPMQVSHTPNSKYF